MRSARSRPRPSSRPRHRVRLEFVIPGRASARARNLELIVAGYLGPTISGFRVQPCGLPRNDESSYCGFIACYCAGATTATTPPGTLASAVLVDLVDTGCAGCGFSAVTVSL